MSPSPRHVPQSPPVVARVLCNLKVIQMKHQMLVTLLFCGFIAAPAFAEDATLTVTGTGEMAVVPDMARISLGVVQEAATAAEAVRAMSADMEKVMAHLNTAGIAPEDIQTSGLRIDMRQDYNQATGASKITGYLATTDVTVEVKALETLGSVLDGVVQDGANQMNGLTFDLQDRKPVLDDARRAAVADAREKASLFAEAADVTLGRIIHLTENGAGGSPQPMMRMAMDSAESIPVAAGQITITANVTIDYALTE